MAIELTPDELTWLRASLRGKTPMITKVVAGSLVAKGLMTRQRAARCSATPAGVADGERLRLGAAHLRRFSPAPAPAGRAPRR